MKKTCLQRSLPIAEFPAVSLALITHLETSFPNCVPDRKDTDREIWIKVGQQDVIKKLRYEFNRQQRPVANVLQ